MKHKIRVSRENIADGVPWDCRRCPVALALRPIIPIEEVYASSFNANGKSFHIGKRMQTFIADFDAGKPVKPIEFWIDI